MKKNTMYREKLKPAVDKPILLLLAGLLWLCVGFMLLSSSYSWLSVYEGNNSIFIVISIAVALLIHHFGFLRIVDDNLGRILPMEGKRCLFSFIPWKSYIVIIIMIIMGALLQRSTIPKQYLSILHTAIGLALILSSVRYLRFFWKQLRKGS
ncbi:MAG: hypothetical protein SVZ03_09180 [Spirochaetota bacterium]|nr:hypothetical protein [Spirochaetota bacterium]